MCAKNRHVRANSRHCVCVWLKVGILKIKCVCVLKVGIVRVPKIGMCVLKGEIDYVNWVELIKFKETRNYVQRVLENVNVYKFMLAKKPIKIRNYFFDKPHY